MGLTFAGSQIANADIRFRARAANHVIFDAGAHLIGPKLAAVEEES